MTTTQIILLIVGILFVLISFFMVNPKNEKDSSFQVGVEPRRLSKEEMDDTKKQLDDIIQEQLIRCSEQAKDELGRISNETIISIDEFSKQILEKIEHNNEEVVFLYNMLKSKEDELKTVWTKMELARRENRELLDKIAELKLARAKHMENKSQRSNMEGIQGKSQISSAISAQTMKKNKDSEIASVSDALDDVSVKHYSTDINENAIDESNTSNHKDAILALYRNNKSVLEISKDLSIGQGEVKLVIDLYGGK